MKTLEGNLRKIGTKWLKKVQIVLNGIDTKTAEQ